MTCGQRGSNLRQYVSRNPPGATFFLCLLTLALSFIVLSSYSNSHTLPNPDIAQDWNTLLSSLSRFYLCEKENASSPVHAFPISLLRTTQEKDQKTSVNTTRPLSSVTVLHLRVPLTVTSCSTSAMLKDIGLSTILTASQLNLGGKDLVNLTFEISSEDSTHICLSISAPTYTLPMTLLPPECSTSESNISSVPVEVTNQRPASSQTCYSLYFKNDPALTVMLTLEEQSVTVRHLVEVSAFLLGICLIFSLAASLKNAAAYRDHLKRQDFQSEPLIES